ncbi:MAG TPA: hypothetical protein VGE14_08625 [Marmoricola sp.]
MKKTLLAVAGALLLVTLTACGSDSSDKKDGEVSLTKEEKTVAGNVAKAFSEGSTGQLTKKESTCFAETFVDDAGLEDLKAAKLVDEDGQLNQTGATFDEDLSGKFADAFLGCVDYHERQAADLAEADPKIDEEQLQACLEKEMPNSYVRKLIVASQVQSADAVKLGEESNKKLTDCKDGATAK